MAEIRPLTLDDLSAYIDHLSRHYGEPGANGEIAQPHSILSFNDCEQYRSKIANRWGAPRKEGAWSRTWGVIDGSLIVGHLEINHRANPHMAHRVILGMGIEQKYRRQGFGTKLLAEATHWIQSMASIDWVDLKVFAHNQAAIDLYQKFRFKEIGRIPDQLRIDEKHIDEVLMALDLRMTK
ncbi:MAG: hypothetical protein RJB66_745 [Pseudomonadota bacterium]|jgi:ribosomal protein S18 acetylase RimI-like enzyme